MGKVYFTFTIILKIISDFVLWQGSKKVEIIRVVQYLSLIIPVNAYVNFSFHFTQSLLFQRKLFAAIFFQGLLSLKD